MPKITEMWCYAIYDKDEDDEGVIAIGVTPLVGADRDRMESLLHPAQFVADVHGKPVRLYRFTNRELVRTVEPIEPERTAHAARQDVD